jgi:hypothetical protein
MRSAALRFAGLRSASRRCFLLKFAPLRSASMCGFSLRQAFQAVTLSLSRAM